MISRRPMSSPGRIEKYPPTFMGLLRSNSNGRSTSRRGRSRASPLFVRRNKSAAAVTQEPSSPKVTCMGQVRVNRSNPKIKPESPENQTRIRCNWIPNARKFAGKIKTLLLCCPKWRLFLFSCSRQKLKKDSPKSQLDPRPETELVGEIGEEIEKEGESFEISKLFVSPTMKRSKSAPYSSSSLAFRFWEENNEQQNVSWEITESEVPTAKINGVSESVNIERNEVDLGFVRRPVLTRSISEPAKDDGVTFGSG